MLFEDPGQLEQEISDDSSSRPLADRMRPRTLDEFVGQEKIVGPRRALRRMIEEDRLQSLIFWGPPGSGKTTLARIIAETTKARFVQFSAVVSGIREVREVMSAAESYRRSFNRRTVVFIDEIHRFNKAQQDAFLPYVESGTIILIGATTENPSFEVNSALLSRSKVFVLEELSAEHLISLLKRALTQKERGLGDQDLKITDDSLSLLANYSSGDARVALNTLELAASIAPQSPAGRELTAEIVTEAMQRAALRYDKAGEEHYNLISAFIKSIRNSDPDAAVYWLARMLEAGEDPMYVARRLIHHASEDIGLADPMALVEAVAAMQATHFIGLPEAKLALTQATLYLALAPKSNSVLEAYGAAQKDALETEREPVPLHLRNASTSLMKRLGYGQGYQYAHEFESGRAEEMDCLPENLRGRKYYEAGKRDMRKGEGEIRTRGGETR
ncbi:MAG TPA: replication-associated recombination protein A [Blastocatellia bacterium]|nr:replication-associated recombination protein A [Blastocatellia bacterium]